MSQKIESLTPEQEARIPEFVDKWVNNITAIRMTPENCEKAVNWLYDLAKLERPKVVICTSPKHILEMDAQIKKDEKIANPPDPEFLGYGKVTDYGWVGFYDFFQAIGVEVTEIYKEYRDIYIAGGIYDAIAYDTHFICCPNPKIVHWNEARNLHCLTGKAVEWEDGFGTYCINGRQIRNELFEETLNGQMTKEKFLGLDNDEDRAAVAMILGDKGLFKLLEATMIDETEVTHSVLKSSVSETGELVEGYEPEVEMIQLWKTSGNDNKFKNEPYAWIVRHCPSTGTMYATPSDPKNTNALEAAKAHRPPWVPKEIPYQWVARS